MSFRVSCPHCNAVLEIETLGRTTCTRCEEQFDATLTQAEERPLSITSERAPVPAPGFLYSRSALMLSCGLSAVILISGLTYFRPWAATPPSKAEIKLPVVVSPLGLSGLRYLPATTNIVVAIQPMPLLAHCAINKLDPRKILLETGLPEGVLSHLDQAGIRLEQIDHVVVGTAVGSEPGRLPSLTAILKLTKPLNDESKFIAQLKAQKNSQQSKGGRTVYSVTLGLPLLMTKLDDQTFAFALAEEGFSNIEQPAGIGGGHLPRELREAMSSKIDPTSFVWIATDTDRWEDKSVVKLLKQNPSFQGLVELISMVRAIAFGIATGEKLQQRLAIRFDDESTAKQKQSHIDPTWGTTTILDNWLLINGEYDPKVKFFSQLQEILRKKP